MPRPTSSNALDGSGLTVINKPFEMDALAPADARGAWSLISRLTRTSELMVLTLAFLLAAHGLIHLLGFARAFGLADLPQLTRPIPPVFGALWLAAACLFAAAAAALFTWPRGWWAIGAGAVLVSTLVIVAAWSDTKFGMLPHVLVLIVVVVGFLLQGPPSLQAEYDGDADRSMESAGPAPVS